MAPPRSNEQLGDEPAMADITPPQPDEQLGNNPSMDDTAHPHLPTDRLGNEPAPMQESLLMPYAAVDSSLRAMAGQAEGFGRHAIGGLHGDVYHVTTLKGTLRNIYSSPILPQIHIALKVNDIFRRRARLAPGRVPPAGASVDRLRRVRHHPPRVRPARVLLQDHRRPRAARRPLGQGRAAAGVRARDPVQPGGGVRARARRRRRPDQARVEARVGGPLRAARLRRRPPGRDLRQHGRDGVAVPLLGARQGRAGRGQQRAHRGPPHPGHHPPLLLRRHAAEAAPRQVRQGAPLQQLHQELGHLRRLRQRRVTDHLPEQHLRGRGQEESVHTHARTGGRQRQEL